MQQGSKNLKMFTCPADFFVLVLLQINAGHSRKYNLIL